MSDHGCTRLAVCMDHPRWSISRDDMGSWMRADIWGGPWCAYGPGPDGEVKPFDTFADAFAYATLQARAEKVAAIQDGAA